jgi:hypothetical protein
MANPFGTRQYAVSGTSRDNIKEKNGIIEIEMQKGEELSLDIK